MANLEKLLRDQALLLAEKKAKQLAYELEEVAKSITPVDTGELLDSCTVYREGMGHWGVKYTAPHSIYAHEQPQSMRKNGLSHFLSIGVETVKERHKID